MSTRSTLAQISTEHDVLRRVLRSIHRLAGVAAHKGVLPDFERLRQLLRETTDLPDRGHHAKESRLLFPLLRERCPALGPVLDRLEAEHERAERLLGEVHQTLDEFESAGEARRAPFEASIRRYVEESLGHIQVEEDYILPVAADYLTTDDWLRLDADFLSQVVA